MSQGLFSTPIRSGIIISWLDPSTTWIQNWNYFEIVHRYDSEVSRRSTLLTKFNITLHWLFILWIPAQVLDTLRFAIGSTFPTALCRAYVYYRWQLKWLFEIRLTTLRGVLQFFKMSKKVTKLCFRFYVSGVVFITLCTDAVFHYRFITFRHVITLFVGSLERKNTLIFF